MSDIQIEIVSYNEFIEPIKWIRQSVFQSEQGVAPELEFDGQDATAQHLLAYLDNQPVGTARIRTLDEVTVKIERLAVLKTARGQGIGQKIMENALEVIGEQNFKIVVVNAQEYIQQLYGKLEFERVGNTFKEAGIPHVKMIEKIGHRA